MSEKKEIIEALIHAKKNQKKNEIMNLFDKSEILRDINRIRWHKGGSFGNGLMTAEEFIQILHENKRTFFTTLNFVGLSKDFPKIKEKKGYFVEMKVKEK